VNLSNSETAVSTQSTYGRERADVQYKFFLSNLRKVELSLKKVGVTWEPFEDGAERLVFNTPFGTLHSEKRYFLDGQHVAVAAVLSSQNEPADATGPKDLFAAYLRWNAPWTLSSGRTFEPDFHSDEYPDAVASWWVIGAMAAKLDRETARVLNLRSEPLSAKI
jgi:hypothetical protein